MGGTDFGDCSCASLPFPACNILGLCPPGKKKITEHWRNMSCGNTSLRSWGWTVRNSLTSAWSDAASQRMTSVSHSPLSLGGVGAQTNEKWCFCSLCEVSMGLGATGWPRVWGLLTWTIKDWWRTAGSCCVSRWFPHTLLSFMEPQCPPVRQRNRSSGALLRGRWGGAAKFCSLAHILL